MPRLSSLFLSFLFGAHLAFLSLAFCFLAISLHTRTQASSRSVPRKMYAATAGGAVFQINYTERTLECVFQVSKKCCMVSGG